MKLKRLSQILLVAVAFSFWCGATCKQARLEPGGAYSPITTNAVTGEVTSTPDLQFYQFECAFVLAYSAIDTAFKFEKDNRAVLWKISPDIKHALDKARPEALLVRDRYIMARKAYLANPTPAGLSGMEAALQKAEQVSAAVQAALP